MATNLRVADLKNILDARGLDTTGTKEALLRRLRENNPDESWIQEYVEEDLQEEKSAKEENVALKAKMADFQKRITDMQRDRAAQEAAAHELAQQRAAIDTRVATEKAELAAQAAKALAIAQEELARAKEETRAALSARHELEQRATLAAQRAAATRVQTDVKPADVNAQTPTQTTATGASAVDGARTEQLNEQSTQQQAAQQTTNGAADGIVGASMRVMQDSTMRVSGPHIAVSALAELVGVFDGKADDFESWARQVNIVKINYQMSDELTRLAILTKLKGKALKWFHSKPDYVEMSVDNLLIEMKKMFCPRTSKLHLRKKFEARTWINSETFCDYVHEKIILGNKIGISDAELIDYIIEGIPDDILQNQARIQRFTEIDDLLCAYENISLNKRHINKSKERSEGTIIKNSSREKDDNKSTRPKDRCYNCGKAGHIANKCKDEKRPVGSCFKCSSTEHKIKNCPLLKQKSETNGEVANIENMYQDEMYFPTISLLFENEKNTFEVRLQALLDSGSPVSLIKSGCVSPSFVTKVEATDNCYYGLNKSKLCTLGKIKVKCVLRKCECELNLLVVEDDTMSSSVILGRNAFRAFGLGIAESMPTSEPVSTEGDEFISTIMNIDIDRLEEIDKLDIGSAVGFEVRKTLKNDFEKLYVSPERPERPRTVLDLTLKLKKHEPFNFSPRRLAYSERLEIRKITDDLLSRGIIRESSSDYCSRVVLVKKKNGTRRMCIDYRTLNKHLESNNFPLPLIEDQIDMLRGKKYFSSLDLKDGFFHVSMEKSSVKYTSFVTPDGQFEFLKMPFGLKVAPGHFQKFVNMALRELIDSGDVAVYIDDILIATETIENHLCVLRKIFRILVNNKLELNIMKCHFLLAEISHLGYLISENGIRPTNKGIEAVSNFPVPKNVKGVQSFVGLASYFRKFIEGFATIAKPLYDLLKKDAKFVFGDGQYKAFDTLKEKLISAPILAIYDPNAETELHCDASSSGFGATLMQRGKDRRMHPIFFFSKRTTETESKYHSFELEMLAIIYALERFRIYLYGIKFKIKTDCNSLTLALKKQDINPRIARWVMELQNYDYTAEHRAGKHMSHVDGLSRCNFIAVVNDNSFETNLILTQNLDVEIRKIKTELEETESKFFELRNGVVYRKVYDRLLFYVPKEMEKGILFKYHDELGHMGAEKVVDVISRSYWFPQMRKKVATHILNCFKCIAFNAKSGKAEGKIQSIPKGDKPFDTIHVDHVEIADKRVKNNKYILLITDCFTKHVKLYACKSTTASEAISHLKTYFKYYSKPNRVITDRGKCFDGSEFDDFINEFDIKHTKVATRSPKANGQAERVNRTFLAVLAKLTDADCNKFWNKVIDEVEFTLNNSVHKSTGEKPSVLLFGVSQRGKVHDPLAEHVDENVNKNVRNLAELRATASEKIILNQAKVKQQADKKLKNANVYEEGDYVMIKNIDVTAGISPKVKPKFKGPYIVKKVLRNNRYVIADVPGWQLTQMKYEGVWEPANMRLWRKHDTDK